MKHRGGQKRIWKKKGRKSATKQYQEYCKDKIQCGQVPTSDGKWIDVNSSGLSESIKGTYRAQQRG